ncbi:hypothetical protein [Spiroplasma phoeniceum]|uniref:Uncharacterized protein n=1 Tax=Spiroplasma phoeniceum P40 TaxID=1276259 RepID=A0A345DMF0_9MOLU|nr:hypothetical protein [Spiroplasma phoeniceum]AXF95388.1 hypothetical protein SDAV_00394 [Spiroplasma phoeniceum P40]
MEEVELEIPKDNYNALDNIFWSYLKIKETSISYPQMLLNKKVIFKIKGHNIKKRNTPKSLAELTSTVNIGDIELFDIDEEHIRNRLEALNHSIFSQPAFLENFIFDSITETRATGHLQQSIMIGTNRIISRINTFTINYNLVATLSKVVPIRNLEHLETNCRH